jgi:hypothetical protein
MELLFVMEQESDGIVICDGARIGWFCSLVCDGAKVGYNCC